MEEFMLMENGEVVLMDRYADLDEIVTGELSEEISKKVSDMQDIADELSISKVGIIVTEEDKNLAYYDSDWRLIVMNKNALIQNHSLKGREYKEAKIFSSTFEEKSVLLSILLHELGHHYVQEKFRFIYHIDNLFREILFHNASKSKNHKLFKKLYHALPEEVVADLIALYLFYKHKNFLKKFEWLGV